MISDPFSGSSKDYFTYRPFYPRELFRYLAGACRRRESAWDVATGNGQAATGLAGFFKQVHATDASSKQIKHTQPFQNVEYAVAREQYPILKKSSIDLVCVAQAIHNLELEVLYTEVLRVLRKYGVFVCLSYRFPRVNPEVDHLLRDYQVNLLAHYSDIKRRQLEQDFRSLSFPLKERVTPRFEIKLEWDFEHFLGYLKTWSSYQKFLKQFGQDPLEERVDTLMVAWNRLGSLKNVIFPVVMKMGIHS